MHHAGHMTRILPRLLSAAEAAAYCGLSLARFHALVAAGDMPQHILIGRRQRWDVRALDGYIDAVSGAGRDSLVPHNRLIDQIA